jgi:hypothetical protein
MPQTVGKTRTAGMCKQDVFYTHFRLAVRSFQIRLPDLYLDVYGCEFGIAGVIGATFGRMAMILAYSGMPEVGKHMAW